MMTQEGFHSSPSHTVRPPAVRRCTRAAPCVPRVAPAARSPRSRARCFWYTLYGEREEKGIYSAEKRWEMMTAKNSPRKGKKNVDAGKWAACLIAHERKKERKKEKKLHVYFVQFICAVKSHLVIHTNRGGKKGLEARDKRSALAIFFPTRINNVWTNSFPHWRLGTTKSVRSISAEEKWLPAGGGGKTTTGGGGEGVK